MSLFFSRLFKLILYPVYFANMVMLLLSLLAGTVDPKYIWVPALIKLLYFLWLFIHCLFTAVFIFRLKKRLIFISLIVLLLSLSGITKMLAMHTYKEVTPEKDLRIMSYNIMGFHWWHRREVSNILQNIKEEQPDIICMQEYLMRENDRMKTLDTLKRVLGYKFYRQHFVLDLKEEGNSQFGLAVFSKIPLKNFTPIYFGNTHTNGAFFVDVPYKKDTFRLVNLHFESFGLRQYEYKFVDSLNDFNDFNDKKLNILKGSVKKLRSGFRKKSFQMEQIRNVIKESPYKVVLCGDFNDTPLSYIYNELTEELDDAFLESGSGFGSTFISKIPFLRIDYILTDPQIKTERTYVVKKKGSDHYPLVSDISFHE